MTHSSACLIKLVKALADFSRCGCRRDEVAQLRVYCARLWHDHPEELAECLSRSRGRVDALTLTLICIEAYAVCHGAGMLPTSEASEWESALVAIREVADAVMQDLPAAVTLDQLRALIEGRLTEALVTLIPFIVSASPPSRG